MKKTFTEIRWSKRRSGESKEAAWSPVAHESKEVGEILHCQTEKQVG